MTTIELQKATGETVGLFNISASAVNLMPQCVRAMDRVFLIAEWSDTTEMWTYREITATQAFPSTATLRATKG